VAALVALSGEIALMQDERRRGVAKAVLARLEREGEGAVSYRMDRAEASSTQQAYFDDCTLTIQTEARRQGKAEPKASTVTCTTPAPATATPGTRKKLTLRALSEAGTVSAPPPPPSSMSSRDMLSSGASFATLEAFSHPQL